MTPVDISVVLPTREHFSALVRTLDALASQQLEGMSAETVVVDNFSADGSAGRLEEAAERGTLPLPVTIVHESTPGAAAARNAGIAAARGELVLLLEDDCRPARADLLAGHVRTHRDAGAGACVVGPVERTAAGIDSAFFSMTNVSLWREDLVRAAGFDERFRGHGAEDHELALRLAALGLRFVHEPSLRVQHARRPSLEESLRDMETLGRGLRLLHELHGRGAAMPRGPRGAAAFAGRLAAPLLRRVPRLPDRLLAAARYAMLAQGYAASPWSTRPSARGGVEPRTGASERPAVSVVVPFAGPEPEARATAESLRALRLRDGDELLLVDNTADGPAHSLGTAQTRVVQAREEQSSYYARNTGAELAVNDWLLFVDADCRPSPRLLDAYFAAAPESSCGALAGAVVDPVDPPTRVGRYATARRRLSQELLLGDSRPRAVTANLLVRREAWAELGGFLEGIRSGGDADFSLRLQEAGWSLGYVPHAAVEHRHRDRLRPLLRQQARYGAAAAWLNRRYRGSMPRPGLGLLPRAVAGIVAWAFSARFERMVFRAIDVCVVGAETLGYLLSNNPPHRSASRASLVLFVDSFPKLSETFVEGEARALERLGYAVRVESLARPDRPARGGTRGLSVSYLEDEGILRRLGALLWLLGRHPARCALDLVARLRWRREEEVLPLRSLAPLVRRIARGGERHLHAHFAALSALNALRASRLTGVPYSVTAHAYDIYLSPRNLREKLERAAFATSGCDYTVEHLRSLVSPGHRERIHRIVMGIDGERFRRRTPYPGGRNLIAVGRLIEKKGFRHLVEAAALLERSAPLERLVIVGEGPLRGELEGLAQRLGLDTELELPGAREPAEVRDLLEEADLLVAPSVVASDGDRDSMPVTVKEALAMELPVVASAEVGLPELVRPEFGRLVAPADPASLARAIAELLALPSDQRAAMGRAGRAFVLEHADVERETARLLELIAATA